MIKKINKKILITGITPETLKLSSILAENGFHIILADKERKKQHAVKSDDYSLSSINNKNIKVLYNTQLTALNGQICNFTAYLKSDDSIVEEQIESVIIATEVTEKELENKKGLAFSEFKEKVKKSCNSECSKLSISGITPEKIALYIDNSALSRLVFSSVMKYAELCKNDFGIEVAVYTPDVLTAASNLEADYRSLRESGVVFIKYTDRPVFSDKADKTVINLNHPETELNSIEYDLVVSAEKMITSEYSKEQLKLMNIPNYNNIHFMACTTPRKGIFICGNGREDMLEKEALNDAEECASLILSDFADGTYEFEETSVEIEKTKCTLCLTCVRTCPHKAIEYIRDSIDERAVRIVDEACFRCGQCVSECPTKALSLIEN
ncbi:MAG: 4Fe-4S binding protein [Victivallales bacterium]|nr:4Fe-4S binding protein [Victivallales bacterium]MCF7888864.1 4Fe-4S binding protein [Victivallales bacterium]